MDASRPTFMASVLQWRHWPERFGRVMATHNYVPQIDGLRFLAIIQVVIYHAAVRAQRLSHPGLEASEGWVRFWPNGVAGVELFFFISGYIIAYPFVSGRKPTLRAFYMRRVTRLEPPYILTVLLCTLVYVAMFGTSLRSDGGSHVAAGGDVLSHTAASLVYAHGLIFQSSPPINPPLWTLEIEIQFYLVAPLLIGGFLMLKQGRVRTAGAFVAVVGAIALQALLDPIPAWHYSLVSHLFAFLFGVAASDWAVRARPLEQAPAAWADALLLVGLTIFIASSAAFYWQSSFLDRMGLLVLRGLTIGCIYIGAMRGRMGRVVFGYRWIAFIGGACYSIYLLHVLCLEGLYRMFIPLGLTGQPLAALAIVQLLLVPVTIACCLLFYIFVERPCMKADWPQRLWARLGGRQAAAR